MNSSFPSENIRLARHYESINQWRLAEVLEIAGPEPDRIDSHAWVKWFETTSKIYKKHFYGKC